MASRILTSINVFTPHQEAPWSSTHQAPRGRQSLADYFISHPPRTEFNAHESASFEKPESEEANPRHDDHESQPAQKTPKGTRKRKTSAAGAPQTKKKNRKEKESATEAPSSQAQEAPTSQAQAVDDHVATWSGVRGVSVDKGLPGEYYVSVRFPFTIDRDSG